MNNNHAGSITQEPVYGMSRAWLGGALNTARRINRELQAKAEGLEAELETTKAERDALTAHVVQLREALRLAKINLVYSEDSFAPQYRNICRKALEATSLTSLAQRDARVASETLAQATNDLYDTLGLNSEQIDFLAVRVEQLRRQAARGAA